MVRRFWLRTTPQTEWNNYTPLAPDGQEIRLLTLARSSDIPPSPRIFKSSSPNAASAQLDIFPFEDATSPATPRYVALSYTWDHPSHSCEEIWINGGRFLVGRNLKLALTTLAHDDILQNGGKMWVDAICINQNDAVERSHQVQRMREIYQRAQRVIIWLGEAADNSDLAIDFINRIYSSWRNDNHDTHDPCGRHFNQQANSSGKP